MKMQKMKIQEIPAIIWGEPSDQVFIHVHGKMSSKESAAAFAAIAGKAGYQTVSFDLPQHGERTGESDRCDIWNGIRDLTAVADYAFENWKEVSVYACSLGAFFSLHAYQNRAFRKCLFQSPILDMEYLIRQMMLWFGVTQEQLERQGEVDTPIDTLSWKYWRYVCANPITCWAIPTHILFAGKDDLQSRQVVETFARRFGCTLTVSENSCHPFMEAGDGAVVEAWLQKNIQEEAS